MELISSIQPITTSAQDALRTLVEAANRQFERTGGIYNVELNGSDLYIYFHEEYLCNFLPMPVREEQIINLDGVPEYRLTVQLWRPCGIVNTIYIDPQKASASGYFDGLLGYRTGLFFPVGQDKQLLNVIRSLTTSAMKNVIGYSFCGRSPVGDQYIFKNGDVLDISKAPQKSTAQLQREADFVLQNMIRILPGVKGLLLLLYAMLSVLRSSLYESATVMTDFLMAVIAVSGSRKTTITSLFFDFHSHAEPALSLRDSAASIRRALSSYRDCVAVIDDDRPTSSKAEKAKTREKIDIAVRAVGDRNSGGKVVQGGTVSGGKTLCLPLVTAENDITAVASTSARIFKLSFKPEDVDLVALTYSQNNAALYDGFIDCYIRWAFSNLDILEVESRFKAFRQLWFEGKFTVHARQCSTAAWFETALSLLCDFCISSGIDSGTKLDNIGIELRAFLKNYLSELESNGGTKGLASSTLEALKTLIHENIVRIVPYKTVPLTNLIPNDDEIIGFYDDVTVFLLTPKFCDFFNRYRNEDADHLSSKAIRAALYAEGFVDKEKHDLKHLTRLMSLNRKRIYVTAIYRRKLEHFLGEDVFDD